MSVTRPVNQRGPAGGECFDAARYEPPPESVEGTGLKWLIAVHIMRLSVAWSVLSWSHGVYLNENGDAWSTFKDTTRLLCTHAMYAVASRPTATPPG